MSYPGNPGEFWNQLELADAESISLRVPWLGAWQVELRREQGPLHPPIWEWFTLPISGHFGGWFVIILPTSI